MNRYHVEERYDKYGYYWAVVNECGAEFEAFSDKEEAEYECDWANSSCI